MIDESPAWGDFSLSTDPPTFFLDAEQDPSPQARRPGSHSNSDTLEFPTSRYGQSLENWASLEDSTMPDPFPIHQPNSEKVAEDDPHLPEALRILGLVNGN